MIVVGNFIRFISLKGCELCLYQFGCLSTTEEMVNATIKELKSITDQITLIETENITNIEDLSKI